MYLHLQKVSTFRQAMQELGIISPNFSQIQATSLNAASSDNRECAPCGSLKHTMPPKRPESLPYETIEENFPKMKAWLLDYLAPSAFNKCSRQQLPMMKTKPIKIHIDPYAVPNTAYTAGTVPIHWREEVSHQLKQDMAIGVIEPVPPGVPTTWQARMKVVAKSDGSPRRAIDFRNLNKNCQRETHHVVPPYKQARLIPAG